MTAIKRATANILLVEDDADLAGMLSDTLAARGYRVSHAATAAEAELVLSHLRPDLIIVDLLLPDRNGLLLCADLKDRLRVPLIICSASRRKEDPALGFRLGADDFLAKPFSVDELQRRLESALDGAGPRRPAAMSATPASRKIGSLVIQESECRATLGNQALPLTPTEYRLLCAVASRPRQVLSRETLADEVWGAHHDGIVRSLDVHMRRLRAKLHATGVPGPRVATRRGFGYQLVDDTGQS